MLSHRPGMTAFRLVPLLAMTTQRPAGWVSPRAPTILLLADLPPWQINSGYWAAANQRDGQITSDYPK
jgi:hypothetical protein